MQVVVVIDALARISAGTLVVLQAVAMHVFLDAPEGALRRYTTAGAIVTRPQFPFIADTPSCMSCILSFCDSGLSFQITPCALYSTLATISRTTSRLEVIDGFSILRSVPDDWVGSAGLRTSSFRDKGVRHTACRAACALVTGAHSPILHEGDRKQWHPTIAAPHALAHPGFCCSLKHAVAFGHPVCRVLVALNHVTCDYQKAMWVVRRLITARAFRFGG